MDDDLQQYYVYVAEKGDTQAEVGAIFSVEILLMKTTFMSLKSTEIYSG